MSFDRDLERLEIGLETIDSLNALRDEVEHKDVIDEGTANILALSVESLLSVARIGATSNELGLPSLEHYQTKNKNKEQCLEKFDEGIKKILTSIIEALKKAFKWIFGLTDKLSQANNDDREFAAKLKIHAEKLEGRGIERDPKKPMESTLIRVEERRGVLEATIKHVLEVERIYRDKLFDLDGLKKIEDEVNTFVEASSSVRTVFDNTHGYFDWNRKLQNGFTQRKKDDLHKRLTKGQDRALYVSSPLGFGQAFYFTTSLNAGSVTLDRYVQDFDAGVTSTDIQRVKDKEQQLQGSLLKNYSDVAEFFSALVKTEEMVFLQVESATTAMQKTVAELEAEISHKDTQPEITKRAKEVLLLIKKLQAAPLLGVVKQLEVMKIQARKLAQGINAVI